MKKHHSKLDYIKEIIPQIIFGALVLGAVVFLIATNVSINKRRKEMTDRIDNLKEEVLILENRNDELKEIKAETEGEDYLEKVARDQMDLKKPGEEVIVIQKEKSVFVETSANKEEKSWWDKIKSIWTR